MSGRRYFRAVALTLAATAASGQEDAADTPPPPEPPFAYRATLHAEINGTLRVSYESPPLPLSLTADYEFVDVQSAVIEGAAVRRYESAVSTVTVGDDTPATTALRPNRGPQRVFLEIGGVGVAATGGPLTHDEAGLLELPLDPLAVMRLMGSALLTDDVSDELTATAFLGVDTVRDVTADITAPRLPDEPVGRVAGTAEAADDGATVSIEFTVAWRTLPDGETVRVDLTRVDKREVGPVSPGMDVTTTAALTYVPIDPPADLAGLDPTPPEAPRYLFVPLPANAAILVTPEWRLFHGSPSVVVLRLLRSGRPVAQANLTAAARLSPGEHTPDAVFRADVANAVGAAADAIGEAVSGTREDGVRFARVVASGPGPAAADDDGPRAMEWRYVLLTAPDGRQLSALFTLDARDADAFAAEESGFINAVRFGDL